MLVKMRAALHSFLAACLCFASSAQAQSDFPSKPVRLVVPWTVGGVTDLGARLLAQKLTESLGQAVIVENKPGANGFIGTEFVARSAPDGYTLLVMGPSTHAVAPAMYRKLPFDPLKDFDSISQITLAPTIAVAPPNSRFKSLAELAAAAKAQPGRLNYATYGSAGSSQLAATLFMQAAGIEMTAIPYKGASPAITGLMRGDTELFFDSIPSSLGHVKAGKLKALAVTSKERVKAAPEVPTVSETYPGVEYSVWQGIQAPAGTPRAIITKLHGAIVQAMSQPDVQERFLNLGGIAVTSSSPEEFTAYILAERKKIAELIKRANIPQVD
jgi:tripartite-type tricarboxylate transporter receptor subunit TctC